MSEDIGQGADPAAWLVRGGEKGEREELALGSGLVIVGWEGLGDIGAYVTRERIRRASVRYGRWSGCRLTSRGTRSGLPGPTRARVTMYPTNLAPKLRRR